PSHGTGPRRCTWAWPTPPPRHSKPRKSCQLLDAGQSKERATDTSGLILMGVRLYNTTTGRFTSPDPEEGGSPTPYAYPTDPINNTDLDGKRWTKRAKKWAKRAWGYSGKAARWLTNSKWGKRIEAGCAVAGYFKPIGAACGIAYTLAYSRQRKWGKAAESAAFAVTGVYAGRVTRGLMKRGLRKAYPKAYYKRPRRHVRIAYRAGRSVKNYVWVIGVANNARSNRNWRAL
ncbi:RHS repeat-associated core domain-containing protein, partial [Brevibacterium otitidis]